MSEPVTPAPARASATTDAPETLAMLDKRRIEAEILKHVYDTLVASHGDHAPILLQLLNHCCLVCGKNLEDTRRPAPGNADVC